MRTASLFALLVLVGASLAGAAPEALRSSAAWAIYPQPSATDWQALLTGANLAAGKSVDVRPQPNYTHTVDPDDPAQLTDGVLAGDGRQMHTDRRAVGWAYTPYVRVTVDLGAVRPVGRVLWRQASLNQDNTLPQQLILSLSSDGESFHPALRISQKTHADDNPAVTYEPVPGDTPAIYTLALQAGAQARYVRLDIAAHGLVIADELAVLAGPADLPALPPAQPGKREWLDNVFDRRDQFSKLIAPGNLAAGLTLRYAPQPDYRLTTDGTDPANLTDGQFGERTDEKIWFEKRAVCWQGAPLVSLFADLGQVQPIASVVGRFLGGKEQGGLTFPDELRVLLSTDGNDYYQVVARHRRGLDDASAEAYDLPEEKVAWVHNFVLPVGYRARYVVLQALHQKQFICADEVAVVKGADTLPDFTPAVGKRVTIVTSGVAFEPVAVERVPIATMPLRCKLALQDARPGESFGKPCKLVLDLPETVRMDSAGYTPGTVTHAGRSFQRYQVDWKGEGTDFRLQSLLPEGKTDTLYTYGDCGQGPENERQITWESIVIPAARLPKRLHMTLAWVGSEGLVETWPGYFAAMKHLGFNGVGFFPRYWSDQTRDKNIAAVAEARRQGLAIIQNESPSGALSADRRQPETHSQFVDGKTGDFCPAYRGQYYQKELASFAQHAVWLQPDHIFYDIEAFWTGAVQEAMRCTRCQERYRQGGFASWDDFRAAMGVEMHRDMKAAIDQALAAAGLKKQIIYGSYRTEPVTDLNDGIFRFADLYPGLLQLAMPSLYVAGNGQAVADNISRNRARMQANDLVPWLSTGCYGEYDPVRTRDLILEALANGARGVTYYWYGHFDAGHFKYHAEATDLVAPLEDLFMDGKPVTGLKCDHGRIRVCGMGAGNEMAVLVSNYQGVAAGTTVQLTIPVTQRAPVRDMDSGKQIATLSPGRPLTLRLGPRTTQLLYVGSKYAAAVPRRQEAGRGQ
ncbi:discoidin domain-containing protein [bacterium]|nr:discoidin domain-containing protein [bacterium]